MKVLITFTKNFQNILQNLPSNRINFFVFSMIYEI